MNSKDLRPLEQGKTEPGASEVEFALVIARMLENVKDDPELQRQMVYDLARYKLSEQLSELGPAQIASTKAALETAINGVERFSREPPRIEPAQAASLTTLGQRVPLLPDARRIQHDRVEDHRPLWSITKRTLVLLLTVGAVGALFTQRERIPYLKNFAVPSTHEVAQTVPAAPPAQPTTPAAADIHPPTKPTRVLPTDYGVYAVIDDQSLRSLATLPVSAPDMRIAISAAFKKPEQDPLPNGRVKFIVFRHDSGNVIPDRADVRVLAKIARDFSSAAMVTPSDTDEAWIMRNIAIPFRTAPIPGAPDMYELHGESPESVLAAGYYALVINAQSYYFQVAGTVTDPAQCIERVSTAGGSFITPCKAEAPKKGQPKT